MVVSAVLGDSVVLGCRGTEERERRPFKAAVGRRDERGGSTRASFGTKSERKWWFVVVLRGWWTRWCCDDGGSVMRWWQIRVVVAMV
ncbi:hypothetical protein PIB30_053411 [Stylosanthes scabra]|uniref:Uncharacterized protein n=1 Tax=Stylosanthes scabra TaxID=79078 RepID=A0ABU6WIF6_9FABA|nr:hypothetical protein [Stylosanthes scabra]